MIRIIQKLKCLFYKEGHPYVVKVSDITIPAEFTATKQRFKKMVAKREYFRKFGKYESNIVLTKDFMLIDGYTTYLLCVENGDRYIEAYFVD